MNKKYKLIVLIGESGSGKSALLADAIKVNPDKFHGIVSYTTRPMRQGEIEGVNYHFVSLEQFQKMVEDGRMLEYTSFNGWFYGTGINALVEDKINIGVFNPAGLGGLTNHPQIEVRSYHVYASDKERLLRQLNREMSPDVDEIVRRYHTDQVDFARIGLVFPDMKLLYNNTKNDYAGCLKTLCETDFGQK